MNIYPLFLVETLRMDLNIQLLFNEFLKWQILDPK